MASKRGSSHAQASLDSGEGAFDAGSYSFFGDMAPLEEGLGGALEDGLEAPPEEFPAEGALHDDDDLPIEALVDGDDSEDVDASLALLMRRKLLTQQQGGQVPNGIAKAGQDLDNYQQWKPPLPPQPQLLGQFSISPQQEQQQQQQETPAVTSQAPAAAWSAATTAAASRFTPAAADRFSAPSGMLTAEELEARMLNSAQQAAAQPNKTADAGVQLLSMLKGGSKLGSGQQQQHLQQQQQDQSAEHRLPGMPLQPGQAPLGAPALAPGMAPFLAPAGLPAMGPGGLSLQQEQQQQLPQQRPLLCPMPLASNGPGPSPFMDPSMISPPQHVGLYGPMPPRPLPPGMPGLPPHPDQMLPGQLLPPHMMPPPPHLPPHPGMPALLQGPGVQPGSLGGSGMGPPVRPNETGPEGSLQAPARMQPLPGQLMPPLSAIPPGFPPILPHSMQQPPLGFKGPVPPAVGPGGLGLQQHLGAAGQQILGGLGQVRPGLAGQQGLPPQLQQGLPGRQQQQGPGSQQGPRQSSPGCVGVAVAGFGGGYDPSVEAVVVSSSGGNGDNVSPAQLVHRFRTHGSEMMAADEINCILRIQHMATHGGHPYLEDFYYQAYLNKYFGGRNTGIFAPAELRDLSNQSHEGGEPRFAELSGLGKVVLSNIRTPKMLMDLSSGSSELAAAAAAKGEWSAGAEGKARPLEQEPMLAARIMIEDCMLLLSDVEDIDRMFAAAAAANAGPAVGQGPINSATAQALLHRRAALLDGIAASFRLPNTPTPAASWEAGSGSSSADGVFLRLMALPKGRALVTKTLRLMFAAPPNAGSSSKGGSSNNVGANANGSSTADNAAGSSGSGNIKTGLGVIWALLRNAGVAFGPALAAGSGSFNEAERRLTDATAGLAAAAAEMMKRLTQPDEAVACLQAVLAGLSGGNSSSGGSKSQGHLLPLFPAGRLPADASPEWLGNVLASLLLRASELGLGSFAAAAAGSMRGLGDGKGTDETVIDDASAARVPAAVAAEWQTLLGRFSELMMQHLWAVIQLSSGSAGAEQDVRQYAHKLACVPLVRGLMAHCDAQQQEQLRNHVSELSQL